MLDALSGREQLRHGLSGLCLCEVARPWAIPSISGYDDTTSPHQTFYGIIYDCNTHSCLWYFYFIAIPSFVCPKLACIELMVSLHNDRHLFADGFVTVRPIAMKFGWDKENVSCLKFRKFCLNPTNFNRKLTMMFKLDLKKITLTAFRTPVQNGLMQEVNIFCTENEHLYAFYAPTKNRTNWMRASCWILFLKKIGHYFWRRVYIGSTVAWYRCMYNARFILWPSSLSSWEENDGGHVE